MAKGSFGGSGNLYVSISWSSTSSISDNSSTVTATMYLHYASLYASARSDVTITCGSTTKTLTTPAISNGNPNQMHSTKMCSTTFTVPHNSDGSKKVTITGKYPFYGKFNGVYYDVLQCSKEVTLDNIPRTSSISACSGAIADGSDYVRVDISRATTAFTHTVKVSLGNYSESATGVGNLAKITIPKSWCNAMPNATSGSANVTVTTYSGSTQIGSTSTTCTITVPTDVVPTLTSLTASIVSDVVPSSWASYIQGKSKCKLAISGGKGSYGSTIKGYEIQQDSVKISSESSTTTGILTKSGTITFKGWVKDSRGRWSSAVTTSITVHSYDAPSIDLFVVQRCNETGVYQDDGTYVRVEAHYSISSCNGNNGSVCSISYKCNNVVTECGNIKSGESMIIPNIDVDSTYTFKCTLGDYFQASVLERDVPTAFVIMDFRKGGRGVSIGKVSERDYMFDVGMVSVFRDELLVRDVNGDLYNVLEALKMLGVKPWSKM